MAYVFETVPADRALIDLSDPREVNWWRKRFECSEQQLVVDVLGEQDDGNAVDGVQDGARRGDAGGGLLGVEERDVGSLCQGAVDHALERIRCSADHEAIRFDRRDDVRSCITRRQADEHTSRPTEVCAASVEPFARLHVVNPASLDHTLPG